MITIITSYIFIIITQHYFILGQLMAKVKIGGGNVKQGKLTFPTCYRGESTYQTIMMKNTSSLPAIFRIQINTHTESDRTRRESKSENVDGRFPGEIKCV
jgi:hypothetical protein